MLYGTNPTKCLSLNVLSSSGSPEAAEYEQIRRGRRFHDPLLPFWVFLYKCQLHFLSPTRKQSRITIALRTIRQRSFVLTRPKVNRPDHGHNWFLKSPYSLFSKTLFTIKFMSFIDNGARSEGKFNNIRFQTCAYIALFSFLLSTNIMFYAVSG